MNNDVIKQQISTSPSNILPSQVVNVSKPKRTRAHLTAGFVSGLVSSVLLQPLDLLKTRVQQSKGTTLTSALRDMTSISNLWRGTLPSAIRTSIGSSLYLTTLNATRVFVASGHLPLTGMSTKVIPGATSGFGSSSLPKLSMQANLLSGAAVRGFVGLLTMPITVIKVRYESSMFQYTSMLQATRSIYNGHGLAGFFKGYGVTFVRDAPNAGLYVLFYEKSKDVLGKIFGSRNLEQGYFSNSAIINTSSAALSAGLATTITGPFDTIKTRVQLDPVKYKSFLSSASTIVKEDGMLGLFDGLSLRMARKACSAGIAWCIYEELVRRS